jgi:hypothetical protein
MALYGDAEHARDVISFHQQDLELLKHRIDDLCQEASVVQQNLSRCLRIRLTMILGHRGSIPIG